MNETGLTSPSSELTAKTVLTHLTRKNLEKEKKKQLICKNIKTILISSNRI